MRSVTIILLTLLAFGCENPFATRQAEPPDQNGSTYINPSIPEIVFINLQLAFQERNVENYIRSFVDTTASQQSFSFIPDQGVAATNPGTFANWNLENERLYLLQLIQATPADSLHSLTFFEESRNEGAQTATFTQDYEIEVRHQRRDAGIPTLFRGQSTFWLNKNETGDWAITQWEDSANGQDPSWSELKVFFQ